MLTEVARKSVQSFPKKMGTQIKERISCKTDVAEERKEKLWEE
jgi:hypothetical protein